jgi:predicted component of type VI protein secretion system
VNFNELLKKISFETFTDIISVSPRKIRETLFAHYNVKTKNRSIFSSIKERKEQRIRYLCEILKAVTTPKEQEFLKELLRNWLFHQRPLLKMTLDYLGIENDDGMIEIETHLRPHFSNDSILIYLSFMEVPFLDKHF